MISHPAAAAAKWRKNLGVFPLFFFPLEWHTEGNLASFRIDNAICLLKIEPHSLDTETDR